MSETVQAPIPGAAPAEAQAAPAEAAPVTPSPWPGTAPVPAPVAQSAPLTPPVVTPAGKKAAKKRGRPAGSKNAPKKEKAAKPVKPAKVAKVKKTKKATKKSAKVAAPKKTATKKAAAKKAVVVTPGVRGRKPSEGTQKKIEFIRSAWNKNTNASGSAVAAAVKAKFGTGIDPNLVSLLRARYEKDGLVDFVYEGKKSLVASVGGAAKVPGKKRGRPAGSKNKVKAVPAAVAPVAAAPKKRGRPAKIATPVASGKANVLVGIQKGDKFSIEKYDSDAAAVERITALLNSGTPVEAISVFTKREMKVEKTFSVVGV